MSRRQPWRLCPPLSNLADGGLAYTLGLATFGEEDIPACTYEQTIKVTVRQTGPRHVETDTD